MNTPDQPPELPKEPIPIVKSATEANGGIKQEVYEWFGHLVNAIRGEIRHEFSLPKTKISQGFERQKALLNQETRLEITVEEVLNYLEQLHGESDLLKDTFHGICRVRIELEAKRNERIACKYFRCPEIEETIARYKKRCSGNMSSPPSSPPSRIYYPIKI